MGSTFHSVTLGSLYLYAVECLMFTLACMYVVMHLQLISVSSSLVFGFGDSVFQKEILPYNSENMDCWKSLPMVRKELMLDYC